MQIDQFISEMLYQHDVVTLPNFGTFLTKFIPSKIDPETNTVVPPSKEVSFNPSMKIDDGKLAKYISKKENINLNQASATIRMFVSHCLSELKTKRKLEFKNIGVFVVGTDGKVRFEADKTVNYLTDSFGLSNVENPSKSTKKDISSKSSSSVKPKKNKKAIIIIIIIVFIIAGITATGWHFKDKIKHFTSELFTKKTNTIKEDLKTVEEFDSIKKQDSILENSKIEENKTVLNDKTINIENNSKPDKKDKKINIKKESVAPSTAIQGKTGKFHLICGSFKNVDNAVKLVSNLKSKGYSVEILTGHGIVRVSSGSYSSLKEAQNALNDTQQKLQMQLWVYEN